MNNSEKMMNELIQSIGVGVEMYTIAFRAFKTQGFSDDEAIKHTKAYLNTMLEYSTGNQSGEEAN